MKKTIYSSVIRRLFGTFVLALSSGLLGVCSVQATEIRKSSIKSSVLQQETIEVKGQVREKDPISGKLKPIPNATILIKETNQTTKADMNGRFDVVMKAGQTLIVRSVGFIQEQVVVSKSNTDLMITLVQRAKDLDEVVVTGFQKIDKSKFTGAAVKLKGDDIKIPGMADVSRMLEGRATGVSLQNVSSTFGSAPKLRIRGATSLTGDNKPLWVVDGVVLEEVVNISNDQLSSGDPATLIGSALAGINANDIESIDILKDAEATGLYGARAMNGVVVITTKRGKSGRMTVNYSGTFSTQLKPNYADYNIMNSVEQMSFNNELFNKGLLNYSSVLNRDTWGPYGKLYSLIETYDKTNQQFGIANTVEARDAYLRKAAAANTNWFDLLFNNQLIQEHSISFTSGTDKSNNYTSVSYYGDNGWTIADKVSRATFNLRNEYNINKKLTVGVIAVGSYRDQWAPGTVNRVNNAVEGIVSRDFDINPFLYGLNTSRAISAFEDNGDLAYYNRNYAPFNIIHELQNNKLRIGAIDAKLQGSLNYKIIDQEKPDGIKLNYDFLGAGRFVRTSQETMITEYSNLSQAYRTAPNTIIRGVNRFLYRNPDFPNELPEIILPEGGFYNRADNSLRSYDIRNTLSFNKKFTERWATNAVIGQQVRYADRQDYKSQGVGYQYDRGGVPFMVPNYFKKGIEQNQFYYSMQPTNERYAAFFANASVSFDKKYNFSANFRYDGANTLGKSATARWLPTWSLGGSWNLGEEAFMKNIKVINSAKVRASYGLVASLGRASNAAAVIVSQNTIRPYLEEKETVLSISDLENSGLTWEKAYTSNIGMDVNLFDNRLSLVADIYQRRSFDLISSVRVSGIGGESVKQGNTAALVNRGVEVAVNVTPVRTKDWNWSMNFNFSSNVSKITRADNNPRIFDLIRSEGGIKEGQAVRGLSSIKYVGLNKDTGIPMFINEAGNTSYNVYFQSQKVDNLVYEGSVDPITTGGYSNTIRWKSFSLSALITFQLGNKIRLNPVFSPFYSDFVATPKDFTDRFVIPGDNALTDVPAVLDGYNAARLGGSYPYSVYNFSTERVVNGDFARLKSMQFSYAIPNKWVQKLKMSSVAVSITGSNMFLLFSDKRLRGQDPEFFNTGGVAQPIAKMYALTLKVGF